MAKGHLLLFLASALLPLLLPRVRCDDTIVEAPAGRFQGVVKSDSDGQSYVAFRGIPFAKPPVGELRFAKPEPLEKIEGTFDASKFGNVCPFPDLLLQSLEMDPGQEDCLNLNIHMKQLTPRAQKKVLVFIHGGGYTIGSAKDVLAIDFLSQHDVILVTVQYRLGILGFLSTGDESSPGNNGLWDMTLALKWVQDNIAYFGGDPHDVTISGESAGGSAVGYLSISPYTKNLFKRAYPQSGSPTSYFGKVITPQKHTLAFAKSVSCFEGDESVIQSLETTKTVVECLRKVPVGNYTSYLGMFALDTVSFAPTVDKDFIPRSPEQLLKDDHFLQEVGFFQRSYLVGIDNNENSVSKLYIDMTIKGMRMQEGLSDDEKEAMVRGLIHSSVAFQLKSRFDKDVSKSVVDKVLDWHDRRFGDDALAYIMGHMGFLIPTIDFLDAAARGKDTKVWLFHFNHYPRYMKGNQRGICHGQDLMYFFDIPIEEMEKYVSAGMDPKIGFDSEDKQLKVSFSSIIAEFTKTGSAPATVDICDWPQYDVDNKRYLDLKPRSEVRQDLGSEFRQLWLEVIPEWVQQGEQLNHPHTEL